MLSQPDLSNRISKSDLRTFKTLKSLGFADTTPIAFAETYISPLDYLTAMHQRAILRSRGEPPSHEEYEYDVFRIDVFGERRSSPSAVTYHMMTWNDPERGTASARDTSVPPSVVS
jgi:hypothetical protein